VILADDHHFKSVNDTHGHDTGDAVLRHVAYTIRKQLRAFDLAYRIGGEEFLVLLPGALPEQAAALAEQIRGAIEVEWKEGVARPRLRPRTRFAASARDDGRPRQPAVDRIARRVAGS
jgi:diguanylate cyclase (GGDEF)-like protein